MQGQDVNLWYVQNEIKKTAKSKRFKTELLVIPKTLMAADPDPDLGS
jgi:hypothetical protein